MAPVLRDRIVRTAKRSLAAGLHGTGLLALAQHVALRRRALVLTYHRVLSDEDRLRTWSHPGIVVSRSTFEWQMEALRRWFTVVPLSDFLDRFASGKPFEPGTCLVTFDDGWRDNYQNAWPVLQRHGVPATVFLPVDYVGTRRIFWQEELGAHLAAIWERAQSDPAFAATARAALAPFGLDAVFEASGPAVRETAMRLARAHKLTAGWPIDDVRAMLTELMNGPVSLPACDGFMTWEEAAEMAAGGVAFGGHGASHRVLTTLSPTELDADVARCHAVLAARLPAAVHAFCYPNGDHDAHVVDAVKRHGFQVGFSTRRGYVSTSEAPMSIPRLNVHEDMTDSAPMFKARLLGLT